MSRNEQELKGLTLTQNSGVVLKLCFHVADITHIFRGQIRKTLTKFVVAFTKRCGKVCENVTWKQKQCQTVTPFCYIYIYVYESSPLFSIRLFYLCITIRFGICI